MELTFQETKLEYLGRTLHETILLEETTDLIVPDSGADALRIVEAYGTALLRGAECSASGAAMSGSVQAGVIYVDQNGAVQSLKAQLPFSARRELAQMPPESYLQCSCTLRSVDARLLNSRKILLRASLACRLTVYSRCSCSCSSIREPSPQLQLRRCQLPLRLPLAVGEKSFPLNEELELPPDLPAISRVLRCCYRLQVAEQKIIGSRAVFKAALLVQLIYEDEQQLLRSHLWQQPFSQFVQLERDLEEAEPQLELLLTAIDTEPDSPYDCRRLLLSANLLAQCRAIGTLTADLIEDAYCTDAQLIPQWSGWSMEALLDRQVLRQSAQLSGEAKAGRLLDQWVLPDVAQWERSGQLLKIQQPVTVNLLYFDPEGALQGKTLRGSAQLELPLGENASLELSAWPEHCQCKIAGEGLEARVELAMTVESLANHEIRSLVGAQIEELPPQSQRRPGVLLQRLEEDGDLWELAKAYHTPVQAILEANELSQEQLSAGTLLLIPL